MSQTARILDVLADGEWHTVREIHARAGYSRLNSRVSELRNRGLVIESDHIEAPTHVERYRYRLVGWLDETQDGPPRGADGDLRLVERTPLVGAAIPPVAGGALPLIEQPDGQLAIEVAA